MTALVVDDHPIARRGLCVILQQGLAIDDVIEADRATAAIGLAREHLPSLVLLDLQMPESIPARELCAQLRGILPSATLILVTAFDRAGDIRDCLLAGADGCLLKDTAEVDLASAIKSVVAGQTIIDPRIAQGLANDLVHSIDQSQGERLTSREREVLDLLGKGYSNRKIADRLMISETTVKGHVSAILKKLHVSSRLEAATSAARTGLL